MKYVLYLKIFEVDQDSCPDMLELVVSRRLFAYIVQRLRRELRRPVGWVERKGWVKVYECPYDSDDMCRYFEHSVRRGLRPLLSPKYEIYVARNQVELIVPDEELARRILDWVTALADYHLRLMSMMPRIATVEHAGQT